MNNKLLVGITLPSLVLIIIAHKVYATDDAVIDLPNTIFQPYVLSQGVSTAFGVAGSTITSPNAEGAVARSIYGGLSYVNHWTGSNAEDGSASFGMTFGDSQKGWGVSLGVLSDSVGGNDPFLKNGGISLRFNHYIKKNLSIAVGDANVLGWDAFEGIAHSYYAVVTSNYNGLSRPFTLTLGAGTGSFYSVNDSQDGLDNSVGPMASLGIGIVKDVSFITDYSSQRLALGVAYTPEIIPDYPISANVSVLNVAGDSSADPRSVSVSIVMSHNL